MGIGINHPRHRLRDALSGQILVLVACLSIVFSINPAQAQDPYVCKLFAREYLRAIYVHNLKSPDAQALDSQLKAIPDTTDTTKLPFLYQKLMATCLASDKIPALPDVPEVTDKVWLTDLIGSHLSKAADSPVSKTSDSPAAPIQQGDAGEKPASILQSQQAKAEATCSRVNMRVAWTNNGRSWRCVK